MVKWARVGASGVQTMVKGGMMVTGRNALNYPTEEGVYLCSASHDGGGVMLLLSL